MTTAPDPMAQPGPVTEEAEARVYATKAQADRERRCIVSGEVVPEAGLIRFVAGPDGVVVADLARKLPGRGLWVTASREAVSLAAKKGSISRAAKANRAGKSGRSGRGPLDPAGSGRPWAGTAGRRSDVWV